MKKYAIETTSGLTYAPWGVYEGEEGSAEKVLLCQVIERETAERIARLLWAEGLLDLLVQQNVHPSRLPELP